MLSVGLLTYILLYAGNIPQAICQDGYLQVQVFVVPENDPEQKETFALELSKFISGSDVTLLQWPAFKHRGQSDMIPEMLRRITHEPYSCAYAPHGAAEQAFFWRINRFNDVQTACFHDPGFMCNPFVGKFYLPGLPDTPLVVAGVFKRENNVYDIGRFSKSIRHVLDENSNSPLAVTGRIHPAMLGIEMFDKEFSDTEFRVVRGHQQLHATRAVLFNQMKAAKAEFLTPSRSKMPIIRGAPLSLQLGIENIWPREIIPVDLRHRRQAAAALAGYPEIARPSHAAEYPAIEETSRAVQPVGYQFPDPTTGRQSDSQMYTGVDERERQSERNSVDWYTGAPLLATDPKQSHRRHDSDAGRDRDPRQPYLQEPVHFSPGPSYWGREQQAPIPGGSDAMGQYYRSQGVLEQSKQSQLQPRSPERQRTSSPQQGPLGRPANNSQLSHSIRNILGIDEQRPVSRSDTSAQWAPEKQPETTRQLFSTTDFDNAFRRQERKRLTSPAPGTSAQGSYQRRRGLSPPTEAVRRMMTSTDRIPSQSGQRTRSRTPPDGSNVPVFPPEQMPKEPRAGTSQFQHSTHSLFLPPTAARGRPQRSPSTSSDYD